MMKKNYYLICVLLLAAFCTTSIATAQNYFGDFPVKQILRLLEIN